MRQINWIPYKESDIDNLYEIISVSLIAYNNKGKIFEYDNMIECDMDLEYGLWVQLEYHNYNKIEILMTSDYYCFGWAGKRLSSSPIHSLMFSGVWVTTAVRDLVFRYATGL